MNEESPVGQAVSADAEAALPGGAGAPASQPSIAAEARVTELHRLLIESVRDYAVFALDPHGYVLTWNPGAERFKGYKASEIIGEHFSVFYPPEKVASKFPDHELRVAAAEGRFEDEGWRIRKDGTRFWANVVITALRDASGELVGFAKVTRDLTERREAEQRAIEDARRLAAEETARRLAEQRSDELVELADLLRRQALELESKKREAEEANRAKSQFLAAMSHELRTPLNAIGGYAELLDLGVAGSLTPAQHEHLGRIRRSQQLLLGIITDILNFSRIESGHLSYDIGDWPVEPVVRSVTDMLSAQADQSAVLLDVAECDSSAAMRADRAKVEQILLNLLSNALKFTAPEGSVTISVRCENGRVRIAVRDTGVGIEPDKLESVFEPFVQVGRSLTSPREGTGLGLAISRDLARAMDGDITVESEVGRGSEFTLWLPRAES